MNQVQAYLGSWVVTPVELTILKLIITASPDKSYGEGLFVGGNIAYEGRVHDQDPVVEALPPDIILHLESNDVTDLTDVPGSVPVHKVVKLSH